MAIGTGLAHQLGMAVESTYGTAVTVSRFVPDTKADLKKVKGIAQGTGMQAGSLMMRGGKRVTTTHSASGSIDLELVSNGLGLLLQQLMGTTVTPVQQGATAAYLQTHTLGDPVGKSLTIQSGVPLVTGTVQPYTFTGCKVTEGDFTFDIGSTSPCMATFNVDARDVVDSTALAAASYPTGVRPFVGTDVTIKAGTFGSEAQVDGVSKASVKFVRGMKTDRNYFGNAGLKSEPLLNAYSDVTGSLDADFIDKTLWVDKFSADTPFSLVIEAKGPLIASTYYQTFRITLPQCFLDGDTPVVDGPDVVSGSFPFTCLFDSTNYPRIEYISTDVTL